MEAFLITGALSPEAVVAAGVCGRIAAAVATGTLPILPGGSFRIRMTLAFALAVVAGATFLAWLDCRDAGLGDDPAAFFESNALVALGSGLAYGPQGAGFARLNFATSTGILSEILERMVTALDLRRAAGR